MADAIHIDDDAERLHDSSIALALSIEDALQGLEGSTVIFALCWVTASVILQCETETSISTTQATQMVNQQIATCVERLRSRTLAQVSQIH